MDEDEYEDAEPAWWCECCEEFHAVECPYDVWVVDWPVQVL